MSGFDGEPVDACSERIVNKARKHHVCTACGDDIRVGDKYSYTSLVAEGSVEVIKRCMRCEYIYRTLRNDLAAGRLDGEYVCPALDCGHRYEETHSGPMPDHLARIAFMSLDELQALDFGELDHERELLRLGRELKTSRRMEQGYRNRFYSGWDPDLEQAARQNAHTCELERKLEVLVCFISDGGSHE